MSSAAASSVNDDGSIRRFRRRLHQYKFVVVAFVSSSKGILLRQWNRGYTNLAGRSLLQFRRQFVSGPITTISTVAPLSEIDRVSVDTKLRQLTLELEAVPLVKKQLSGFSGNGMAASLV